MKSPTGKKDVDVGCGNALQFLLQNLTFFFYYAVGTMNEPIDGNLTPPS